MRNATKRKTKLALSALAAAGLSAWAGTPSAHGDFVVSVTQTQNGLSYQGNSWDVYVLSATNTGTNGTADSTGTFLEVAQVIIDTGGPSTFASQAGALGFDIERTTGSGTNTKYNVNLNGSTPVANGIDAGGAPVFGDVVGGTFVGIGTGAFTTDLVNNPQTTQDGVNSPSGKGGTVAQYVNGQTSDYLASGNSAASYLQSYLNKATQLDNGFENGTNPTATVNAGNVANALLNGKVHSLEVDTVSEDSSGNVLPVADDAANGPVPFANVVVPHGTVFTVHGGLAGGSGGAKSFSTVIGASPIVTTGVKIQLTAPAGTLPGTTSIGTVTMTGAGNGSYNPQTASPTGAAQTKGALTIAGFNPPNDQQIVGLDVTGATSLTTLFTDLQAALQGTNPGATVFAPSGSAASILTGNGDNVEILFPTASTPNVNPEALSYDTSGYTSNGATVAVTQITVLPEPTVFGALALGGLGILGRRRRKVQA
jgi:hypothetical protein